MKHEKHAAAPSTHASTHHHTVEAKVHKVANEAHHDAVKNMAKTPYEAKEHSDGTGEY